MYFLHSLQQSSLVQKKGSEARATVAVAGRDRRLEATPMRPPAVRRPSSPKPLLSPARIPARANLAIRSHHHPFPKPPPPSVSPSSSVGHGSRRRRGAIRRTPTPFQLPRRFPNANPRKGCCDGLDTMLQEKGMICHAQLPPVTALGGVDDKDLQARKNAVEGGKECCT